jgi:pyruvate dehydrogenase E1 component
MSDQHEIDRIETREWLDSLSYVLETRGGERAAELLRALQIEMARRGISLPAKLQTPYLNTISAANQPRFPGSREIERRIKSILRWNAMAMVVRANREESGIGGHISTYASAATLFEVGFNHFFRGPGSRAAAATTSSSRATPRRASTPGRSSRAG